MKLLTQAIKSSLPIFGSTEHQSVVPVAVKFFCPWNNWTWYAFEGEYDEELKTYLFFGLVDGHEKELGYFALSELEQVKGPFGLKIERDMGYRGEYDKESQTFK